MNAREEVLKARKALLKGKLSHFERRGLLEATVKDAWIGYTGGELLYPCIARTGGLLAVHYKAEARNGNGKRRQRWGLYADELPRKGRGKKPEDPAKIIPFGLETLRDLKPNSLVILCCGEEDALSLRQLGFTGLSQPGAGLLEPAYARELTGFEVVVFYDAGEEREAHKDALTVLEAGAASIRIVTWSPTAPHGADINAQLVADREGFKAWATRMIEDARPPSDTTIDLSRPGAADVYTENVENAAGRWPELAPEALYGLPGDVVRTVEPHTEAAPVAVLANMLCAFGNAIGRGAPAKRRFFEVGDAGLEPATSSL